MDDAGDRHPERSSLRTALTGFAETPNRWVTFSLLIALVLLAREPPREAQAMFHMIVLAVLLALSLRWRVGPLALVALLAAGIDLRVEYIGSTASDVEEVIRAAIERMVAGQNPYGVGYAVSDPPGAPFPYGPLVLLWYLPWHDPGHVDLVVSIAILAVLVARGHMLGAAIYATAPALLPIASDGSNDTSAGLLLLIALVGARHSPVVGAALLGVAFAFKPYALAWAPGLVALAGVPALIAVVVGAAVFWLPALLAWGPASILQSYAMANRIDVPPWYSLGQVLDRFGQQVPREAIAVFRHGAALAVAAAVMATVRSWRGVIIGGIVVFLAGMYLGHWSSFAYLSAIAPIVCWYIDEWLGQEDRRIRWPLDPVGRVTEAFDRYRASRQPAAFSS